MNAVHTDSNWRQRLRAEQASAGQWRDQWGFLEQTKPAGSVFVDRHVPNHELTRTIAEQGVIYPFLLQTHRDEREGRPTVRHVVAGTAPIAPPSASQAAYAAASNSNAFTLALQQQQQQQQQGPSEYSGAALTGSQIMRDSPSRLSQHQRTQARSPSTSHQQQQSGACPPSPPHSSGLVRPSTPVLHLDRAHSQMLMPGNQQDIGSSVITTGVDPHVKYRHPLTASHRVGWNVNNTLEFFGVAKHAKHELSTRRLYGWD